MKKLNFDIYIRYREIIERYLEIEPNKFNEKIDTATLQIENAILDINRLIDRFNNKRPDLGIYYQVLIKTDFLISVLEFLYEILENYTKDGIISKIFKKDKATIRNFRLLRSLTLAHPLETTYFNDLGYGYINNKWCEDIIPRGGMHTLFNNDFEDADFILKVKEQGKEFTNREPVYLEKDIINVAEIILNHIDTFTNLIENKLSAKIESLRQLKIDINKEMPISDYIAKIKSELKIRFPNEIEKYEEIKESGKIGVKEHCILDDALEMINIKFNDEERNHKFEKYKKSIIEAIYEYGNGLQNMNIEKERDKIHCAVFPDSTFLESKNIQEMVHYKYEKISQYLFSSNTQSYYSAKEKLELLSYDGCKQVDACTNAEWGVIQLLLLKDEIEPYFPLDFKTSDRILFAQFCAALHNANTVYNLHNI